MPWREKLKIELNAYVDAARFETARVVSSVLVPIGWNREMNRDEILLTKRTMLV
jgi:hypothetical protein